MKNNEHFSTVRALAVLIAVAGLLFLIASAGLAESGKAYVSSQDGTKMFVFDLNQNSLVKTIDISAAVPQDKPTVPNINDVVAMGDKVFVTVPGAGNAGINEIKVIDVRSDAVVGSLRVDAAPSGMVKYKESIFVVNKNGNTIQEIDPGSVKIIRTIPFTKPESATTNSVLSMEIVNDKIYLPFSYGASKGGSIQVMDLKTGKLIKSIKLDGTDSRGPLAIKKVGEEKIYLGGTQNMAVLDTRSDTIVKVLPFSGKDSCVQSFTLCEGKVYAARDTSTVSVIDAGQDTLISEVDIGYHSYAHHLRAGIGSSAHSVVASDAGRGLKIIDAATNRIVSTVGTGAPLGQVAVVANPLVK